MKDDLEKGFLKSKCKLSQSKTPPQPDQEKNKPPHNFIFQRPHPVTASPTPFIVPTLFFCDPTLFLKKSKTHVGVSLEPDGLPDFVSRLSSERGSLV